MKPFLTQLWRTFWTLSVAVGITIAVYRLDHLRAEAARTEQVAALSAQIFAQFELLAAPGTLKAQDRVNRAVTILNTGPQSKPLSVRTRTAQESETDGAQIALSPNTASWSRRLALSQDTALELKWSIPESRALGATSAQDADLRLALVFFAVFLALWTLGRRLFAGSDE